MPFYLSLAFKNVFRQKRRSFTLGINFLIIALVLFLLFSVSAGIEKNIGNNLVSTAAGHLSIAGDTVVKGKTFIGISDYPLIVATVKQQWPETRILVRYYVSSAVYYQGLSKRLAFTGIDSSSDLAYRDQMSLYAGSWDNFAKQANGILLPRETAEYFGLGLNDEVVVATRSRYGAFNTANFKVLGLYDSGNYFVQGIVVAHFTFLQALDLADPNAASNIFVYWPSLAGLDQKRNTLMDRLSALGFKVSKPDGSSGGIAVIAAASPQYKVQAVSVNEKHLTIATIDEVLAILNQIIVTINAVGLFVAAILLFISAVSIFINMRMSINDRMQEIGTLRAMGTPRRDIIRLFVFENVFLSLLASAAGIVIGLFLVLGLSWGPVLPAKGVLALFLDHGHLALVPRVGAAVFILFAVATFTAAFSWFPARHGGSIGPAAALSKTF